MSTKSIRSVLFVGDDPRVAQRYQATLDEQSVSGDVALTYVPTITAAEQHLASNPVDIVLLDIGVSSVQGLKAVRRAHVCAPGVPLVVVTALDSESLYSQALKDGAQDCLVKNRIEAGGLLRTLCHAVERKSMHELLFAERERALVTLASIGEAVASADISGNITYLNRVAERLTGWSLREAIGKPMKEVVRIVDDSRRELMPNPMDSALRGDRAGTLPPNCWLVQRNGLQTPVEDSVAPIHDKRGNPMGVVIVFRDVSANRTLIRQMAHAAEHDVLTGLPNRMLLNDRAAIALAMARRHGTTLAVLFLDIDGFKYINDSLGHAVGDKLLQSIAQRIVCCVRDSDTVSRQGGDEYVVLLSEVEHAEDPAVAARRILCAIEEPHLVEQHELRVTASIGVSLYPEDGEDAQVLIANADMAMYQVKENGRRGFRFFRPEMNVRVVERQWMEGALRLAFERQELTLHFQPKVNLRSGAIVGAESLIRWNHPVRGWIPPSQFIPIAEACGLILPIGAWVLRKSCEQARSWLAAGLPLVTMAVNVSALEFCDSKFLPGLFSVLSDTGLAPSFLEVELTESVIMQRVSAAADALSELRAHGVKVAIDDFGTGYSSLSYLRRFPIDALKIDRAFIRQISAGGEDATIVTAIIGMAQNLKLRVVAEGVESEEELAFLRLHHCDEAQGFYLSPPVPAQAFARLLKSGVPGTCRGPAEPANVAANEA